MAAIATPNDNLVVIVRVGREADRPENTHRDQGTIGHPGRPMVDAPVSIPRYGQTIDIG